MPNKETLRNSFKISFVEDLWGLDAYDTRTIVVLY